MMRRLITTLCIGLISACFLSASSAPKVRIACIGDSITYGSGLEDRSTQSYPILLRSLLGDGYEVRNFGISARIASSEGDHPYMLEAQYDTVKTWLPDVVTIMLGTNDSKNHNWNPRSFFQGYINMVRDLKSIPSHPRIILVTPPPAGQNGFTIRDSVIKAGVIPGVMQVARNQWLDVIDMYNPMMEHMELFADGVHPNAAGARIIAGLLADALKDSGIAAGPRVMFVGDSITDGFWGRNDGAPASKRDHYDRNHVYGHGYQAVTIGKLMSRYPEKNLRCYNRGWGGDTLDGIIARWDEEVMAVRPSVISLLVGVNDTRSATVEVDVAAWEAKYRALIDRTLKELPDVKFVLCTPFFSPECSYQGAGKPENIRPLAAAVRRIAADYGFICVDFAKTIDGLLANPRNKDRHYWLWDGIHPTYATHELMSEAWLKTVGKKYFK